MEDGSDTVTPLNAINTLEQNNKKLSMKKLDEILNDCQLSCDLEDEQSDPEMNVEQVISKVPTTPKKHAQENQNPNQ